MPGKNANAKNLNIALYIGLYIGLSLLLLHMWCKKWRNAEWCNESLAIEWVYFMTCTSCGRRRQARGFKWCWGIRAWLKMCSGAPLVVMRGNKKWFSKANKEEGHIFDLMLPELSDSSTRWLTYVPGNRVTAFYLIAANDVPHTCHPVSQEGKHWHKQSEDHSAVLGIAIQFL